MPLLPYGSWPSPIEATEVAASSLRIDGARFVGEEIWWSETLPGERGRTAILRAPDDGGAASDPEPLLPAPWSARSRVHEYGGGAWTASEDGILFFVEHADQRIWRLAPGGEPEPLTPEGAGMRFGDLTWSGGRLLAVRETHTEDAAPSRAVVDVCLEGTAEPRVLASGRDFYAAPRLRSDGRVLAYIAWDHPDMPWDEAELIIARPFDEEPDPAPLIVAGGHGVAALQPEWTESRLWYSTDASGRWQLASCKVHAGGMGDEAQLTGEDADTGGPLWNLGAKWYTPLSDGRTFAVRTDGRDALVVIDPAEGSVREIKTPLSGQVLVRDARGSRVLVTGAGDRAPMGLWVVDTADDASAPAYAVRGGALTRDPAWYPVARAVTFEGPSGPVHAYDYPPTNPGAEPPEGARPPYLVTVHGGPTAHVAGEMSPTVAYFTSRGIGVLDVNYGGSSGYGRAYRERLNGQWGVRDVEDVAAAASGLAAEGTADGSRMAIKGGSAGGWTVLSALASTDVFAAGISRYGVADLRALVADTHDFEARYLDGLVGPLPAAEQLYIERSPLTHIDRIGVPVLLLQGADDRVVPPSQALAFRDALAAQGIAHALVVYEGEAHGFRQASTIIHAIESELSFLGQVFGFETPGVAALPLDA